MYGSRTLSSVLMKAMSSYIEDIDLAVMQILFLLFDLQVRAKTILNQINSWIKTIEGFQDLGDLQTLEIDERARLIILSPTLKKCASSKEYDLIVTSYFDGKGFLQRAIESERHSTVLHLVNLLRTKNYNLLEWETQHLLSTHTSFSKIAPKILPCLSFFIMFYKNIGWYPEPLDFNKGLDIFHFILEFYSFFYKSLPLKVAKGIEYFNFLKNYEWNNGLLYYACETGKHENICWSIDFLKNIFDPKFDSSPLWFIHPLSIGEKTIVTVLMSSGKTDQDI